MTAGGAASFFVRQTVNHIDRLECAKDIGQLVPFFCLATFRGCVRLGKFLLLNHFYFIKQARDFIHHQLPMHGEFFGRGAIKFTREMFDRLREFIDPPQKRLAFLFVSGDERLEFFFAGGDDLLRREKKRT